MSSTLTDREKDNLIKFWEAYNARNNPLLDDPWTPSFGHSPANLIFTDEEDPAGCPGQNWQGTQTAFDIQEPPQESHKQLYPVWGYCFAFILLGGSVAFIWAFLGYVFPWLVRIALGMVGYL